jgi:hypothetical protein
MHLTKNSSFCCDRSKGYVNDQEDYLSQHANSMPLQFLSAICHAFWTQELSD